MKKRKRWRGANPGPAVLNASASPFFFKRRQRARLLAAAYDLPLHTIHIGGRGVSTMKLRKSSVEGVIFRCSRNL